MSDTIGYGDIVAMIRSAAQIIRDNEKMLGELDKATGDGDHGTTIARAMALAEKSAAGAGGTGLKKTLHDVGWAVLGVDGGATGPLLGSLFMGMSDAAEGKDQLDARDVAAMFEAGLAKVGKLTKARVGDKTMMDALVPAVEALRRAADDGSTVAEELAHAADAAAAGAQSTFGLTAKFGRAKNLKELSIGSQDAGAASTSLIFRGFSDAANAA